jgi:hypothetical protein
MEKEWCKYCWCNKCHHYWLMPQAIIPVWLIPIAIQHTSSIITVTVNKNPKAIISAGGPTEFCAGGSVTLTETPSGGCTYQWYKGAAPIPGATAQPM